MNASVAGDKTKKADGSRSSSVRGKCFLEFFAGIGLVEEGLRPSGWTCVYANDIDTRKQAVHATRNGPVEHYHLEDVRKTDEIIARIPDSPFLATASFPCIDLSVAGHYRGMEGEHSSTFFAFVETLKALGDRKPRLVMLENVVGFLSSRQGLDFQSAVRSLAELGYWLDTFILDARHFVPQSRPRVFVLAFADELRSTGVRGLNLIEEAAAILEPSPLRPPAVIRVMRSLVLPTGWAPIDLPLPPRRRCQLEDLIDLDDGQEWWEPSQVERHYKMMSDAHRKKVDLCLATKTAFVGTIFRRVRRDGQRAEVRFDGLAGCLRTPRGGSGRQIVIVVHEGNLRMRWMSPREYARLQGVSDFPLTLPTNQLLYGFADAVCVPAIRWIDQHVLTPLYESASPARRNGRA